LPGFSFIPVGATPLAHFARSSRQLIGEDADAAFLGLSALLAVEQLADVLTQAQPIGASVRTAGSGTKSLPEASGIAAGHGASRTVEEMVPIWLLDTPDLQRLLRRSPDGARTPWAAALIVSRIDSRHDRWIPSRSSRR
jgi:hypothetical protein